MLTGVDFRAWADDPAAMATAVHVLERLAEQRAKEIE